jgi:hypothetical protein
MGSTRALIASIGVSASLVAAAALSLFTVSVVIAFGGWSAGMGESAPPATLVIAGTATTHSKNASARRSATPVVLRARALRPQRRAAVARPRVAAKPVRRPAAARAVHRPPVTHAPAPRPQPAQAPPVATPPAPAPKRAVPTGDGVRRLGDDLSSAAQNTGKALSDVTAPLAPPVSSAVQKVLDVVAEALQRTTNGLGGTLDKLDQR